MTIFSLSEFENEQADLAMAMRAMTMLRQHYPGHPWQVNAEAKTGTVQVKLNYTDALGRAKPFGFVVHIDTLNSEDGWREIMRAGGELLERRRMVRGPAKEDSLHIARANGFDVSLH